MQLVSLYRRAHVVGTENAIRIIFNTERPMPECIGVVGGVLVDMSQVATSFDTGDLRRASMVDITSTSISKSPVAGSGSALGIVP